MTHIELLIMPKKFHLVETHFYSILLKMLSCRKKWLCDNLLNANKTYMKLHTVTGLRKRDVKVIIITKSVMQ
jgi:hypothetical protein